MKYTLLEMTQDVLSNLDSDEISSIADTPESMQVAKIIRQKYFDIVNRLELPDHYQLLQLDPSGDINSPVLMYVPDGIQDIKWIKYYDSNTADGTTPSSYHHSVNTDVSTPWTSTSSSTNTISTGNQVFTIAAGLTILPGGGVQCLAGGQTVNTMTGTVVSYVGTTLTVNITATTGFGSFSSWVVKQNTGSLAPPGYLYVQILPFEEFFDMVSNLTTADSNVRTMTLTDDSNGFNGSFTFNYRNDRQPQYCTVLSNYYVIFDSYDATQDSTLQASKSAVYGGVIPSFTLSDTFVPILAEEQFPLLLNEAKQTAFFELKQQAHPLANQEVKRGWSTIQKKKSVANKPSHFDQLPNFGRRRGVYGYQNLTTNSGPGYYY